MNHSGYLTPAVVTVLALAIGGPVFAQDQPASLPQDAKASAALTNSTTTSAKTAPAAPKKTEPSAGMVVFIDPATGKIRQPTQAEIGSLARPARDPNLPATLLPEIKGPGNAVGIIHNEDTQVYAVVTLTPDGKLVSQCVTGDKAADAAVKAQQSGVAKQPEGTKAHPGK